MSTTSIASGIQREFESLPEGTIARLVMMDPEVWEQFLWEVATDERYINTEVRLAWMEKRQEYQEHGRTGSEIKSLWCPSMGICFFRNPYIQKIRVTYSRR